MEREFLAQLRNRLPPHPQLLLGVGDDAAVLKLAERANCVATADLLAEGAHFELPETDRELLETDRRDEQLRRVGRKSLAVNLSDIAAMAARPLAAVVSLLLPKQDALDAALRLYEGILPLAEQFHVGIAGGDTNCWDGALVVSVMVLGETTDRGSLRRDGARPGDAVLVTGELGGSRLGKHLDFVPRVSEALTLHRQYDLHAGMDISDGLALDLSRICAASGVGAVLEAKSIPVAPAAGQWAETSLSGRSPLDHALSDGEDFELLLTAPPQVADRILRDNPLDIPITKVGHCVDQPGLCLAAADGSKQTLDAVGFEHG